MKLSDPDELADAMEELEISDRQRLISEMVRLKEAVWFAVLALIFIAFLVLRLG